MTKYDLAKSSLMLSTTVARSTAPDPSLASLTSVSGDLTSDFGRIKEAAIPKSSEPYQAAFSRAFCGAESGSVEEDLSVER